MTRDEAVRYFKRHIDLYCVEGICREAEEIAIEALEREPCEDAISRQAVIDAIYARYIGGKEAVDKAPANDHYAEGIDEAVCAVEDMPPVTPQLKIGHWILHQNYNSDGLGFEYFSCSECDDRNDEKSRYCPNCGAKMQEIEE